MPSSFEKVHAWHFDKEKKSTKSNTKLIPVDQVGQRFNEFLAEPWFQWSQCSKLERHKVKKMQNKVCQLVNQHKPWKLEQAVI